METPEEIEKLAIEYCKSVKRTCEDGNVFSGYVNGYKKCQENRIVDLVSFIKYYKRTAILSFESSGENLDLTLEEIAEKYIKSLENK